MKKLFVILGVCALSVLSVKNASAQCYSKAEAEADQGIRIHSELMVIGLNCQRIGERHGLNLYGDYRSFTAKNAKLFSQYENILMDFYKRNGKSPKESLNDIRTRYANNISESVSKLRPDVFCAKYAERIELTKDMSSEKIRQWASSMHASHPVSYPLCKG